MNFGVLRNEVERWACDGTLSESGGETVFS